MNELCDFCSENADWGFDLEWDALLCWICHLSQNTSEFIHRNRAWRMIPDEAKVDKSAADWLRTKLKQQKEPEYVTRVTEEYRKGKIK